LLNREIEKAELKKGCLTLLTGQHFDLFDAMRRNVTPFGFPQLDLAEAEAEGRYIQFFEQAFEWVHMLYVFYPYFWGRKAEWPTLALLDDADPLFARFLQAGAARVQVPVRPGYEEAVAHYMESGGNLWDGGEPPHVGDELYLSIIDEIKEQQGAEAEPRAGTLAVTQGSPAVTGTGTDFSPDDLDRRLTVAGRAYRIADVSSPTSLTLSEAYRGPTRQGLRYTIGAKYIGEPWEVRVPTSLIYLQSGPELPDFTQSG
jgi:hypothetical protein